MLFQEKKDDLLWLCVDYRGLNAFGVQNVYLLSLLKDMLGHLAKRKVFTKLDLREAFNGAG